MRQFKRITLRQLLAWEPCGPWSEESILRVTNGRRQLTPLEIVDLPGVSAGDKLWVLLREEVLPENELRLFACWCAERVLRAEAKAGRPPDKRSRTAVRVARAFARGEATAEELSSAWSAAWSATSAESAAWSAAESAAAAAAWSASAAAWSSAYSASVASAAAELSSTELSAAAAASAVQLRYLERVLRRRARTAA